MKVEKKIRRLQIICGFLMFFLIFVQKVSTDFGWCSIWDVIFKASDGSFMEQDMASLISAGTMLPVLLSDLLYLIRSFWLLKKEPPRSFTFCIMLFGIGFSFLSFFLGQLYAGFNIVIMAVDFMGTRMIEEMDAANAAYKAQKAADKAEKERLKRIQYFPGKYPVEFFRMIKKNYVYGKRGQMILVAGCFLTSSFLYIMLTMYSMVKQIHGKEDFVAVNGLSQIFLQSGLLVVLFCILMMVMIISYYIKDQKKANRLTVILGMRSRTVYLTFAVAFGFNMILGGVAGAVCGIVISAVMRSIIQSGLLHTAGEGVILSSAFSLESLGTVLLVYLFVVLFSLVLNQDYVRAMTRTADMNSEVQREHPVRRYIPIFIISGTLFCLLEWKLYTIRGWAESMYIQVFGVAGILLLLIGGSAFYLKRLEKNQDRYNRKIIVSRPFYYQYWNSILNLFYMTVVHFFVLAVFGLQFIGTLPKQNVEELYPYDIVCTAYDADIEDLSALAEKHGAQEKVYPMVRMTSIYGSDTMNVEWAGGRPIQWPQGQHIAISESAYRELKEAIGKEPKKLGLTGDEIHVVYQQDISVKANTIDWDTGRVDKRLRIGQPLTYYDTNKVDDVFPVWTVKSEERDVLTGSFHQGMQDNLIVFNDEYFQEQYDRISGYNKEQWSLREGASYKEWDTYTIFNPSNMTEGPTNLLCFTVPAEGYEGMLEDMQYLEEKYHYDAMWDDTIHQFYGKRQMKINAETEILFRRLVYLFVVLLVAVMGFFQYFVRYQSEARQLRWQNNFLKKLGMREKERKKALAGQMKVFAILPLAIGGGIGIVFSWLTVKARLYDAVEIRNYMTAGAVVYLVYILVCAAWYFMMKRMIWRQAEWDN